MAAQIPDPRSLESWEDAFQYPLPVVRKLEQQLRRNIDENREKLRSLVGASYRDLLGTAERIIEMDSQVQTVESSLVHIGQRCNARTLDRVSLNHANMKRTRATVENEQLGVMANTKLLQKALTTVARLVKNDGDALQAAKVLVLARLFLKHVSESAHGPPVIEHERRKLTSLRKRLMSYIEQSVTRSVSDKNAQANALCAYALITSSTPREVLRYFLQARFQALQNSQDEPNAQAMLQMLELYSQTLLDVRDLFPRTFAESFARLAKVPVIQDQQVQILPELGLDTYESWIAADVKWFTPWTRQEPVTKEEVAETVSSWTKGVQRHLREALRRFLGLVDDPRVLCSIRQKVIVKYMMLSNLLDGQSSLGAIDSAREAFLARLVELAGRVGYLDDLIADDSVFVGTQTSQPESLWSVAADDFDFDKGAFVFRTAVIDSRHGRDKAVHGQVKKIETWFSRVTRLIDVLNDIRATKWDRELDFDFEDIDASDALAERLNKQDPEMVSKAICNSINSAYEKAKDGILLHADTTPHPAYRIRLWRELERRRLSIQTVLSVGSPAVNLAPLYRNISRSITSEPLKKYGVHLADSPHIANSLWDGSPALPVQPTPATFRFLKSLQASMASAGTDLWSSEGVRELTSFVAYELVISLKEAILDGSRPKGSLTNGHEPQLEAPAAADESLAAATDSQDSGEHDRLLQMIFDVSYLTRALGSGTLSDDSDRLSDVGEDLRVTLELDDTSFDRIKRNAGEYWKRTHLLFGLLAPAHSSSRR